MFEGKKLFTLLLIHQHGPLAKHLCFVLNIHVQCTYFLSYQDTEDSHYLNIFFKNCFLYFSKNSTSQTFCHHKHSYSNEIKPMLSYNTDNFHVHFKSLHVVWSVFSSEIQQN